MKATTYIQREVKKEMKENGTLAKLNARHEHFQKVAKSLGYSNGQAAFDAMGIEFIKIARKNAPSING